MSHAITRLAGIAHHRLKEGRFFSHNGMNVASGRVGEPLYFYLFRPQVMGLAFFRVNLDSLFL